MKPPTFYSLKSRIIIRRKFHSDLFPTSSRQMLAENKVEQDQYISLYDK